MGADSTLVFYGVRYALSEGEHEPLELRLDPRQQDARRCKLDSWWGRCATEGGEQAPYLFIGAKLGSTGYEGQSEISRSRAELARMIEEVGVKLERAGIEQEPRLYIQFCPDD